MRGDTIVAESADGQRGAAIRSRDRLGARAPTCRRIPDLPDVLPGVDAPAVKNAVVWNTLTPRIGATSRSTASTRRSSRGSYAAFASQLNVTTAERGLGGGLRVRVLSRGRREPQLTTSSRASWCASSPIVGINPENPLEVVNPIAPELERAAHARGCRRHRSRADAELRRSPRPTPGAATTTCIWPLTQLPVGAT